jgi:CPA2 family monovalent cation:H+ antiporter-2
MVHSGQEVLIKDAVVFLFAAGLVVPALRFAKIPAVLSFILAGIALGPAGMGGFSHTWPVLEYLTISDPAAAAPFAELGVLFLLFLLGLELSFEKLWALRRLVFGAGSLQAGVSALVIGTFAFMIGFSASSAAVIGFALALSSTAIVMQLLIDEQRASTVGGRSALSVLLFQDILVAPILIMVGFLSKNTDAFVWGAVLQSLFNGIAALVIILFIGHFLLRPLFKLAASTGGRDFLIATTFLTVVGAAVLTASAGLSLALGAFLAGLMLGETEFKHQAEVDIEPFKSLLLGLFFMTVGMGLDLSIIADKLPIILGCLCLLIAFKFAIAFLACRLFNKNTQASLETAFLLAPAGEFAFIVLAAGSAGGLIDAQTGAILGAIAGLSMLITPALSKLGVMLAKTTPSQTITSDDTLNDYSELEGHVIIAGFGRVGQTVAHILDTEKTEFVALETDIKLVSKLSEEGWRVYLGDGSRREILEKAGIHGARLAVLTLNDAGRVESIVRTIRNVREDIQIIVRSRDSIHARELYAAGANFVVPETIEAGLQMASRTLQEFGYDGEAARDRIAHERDREYKLAHNLLQEETK